MKVVKPPSLDYERRTRLLFLAGSIEMGAAEQWQAHVERALAECAVTILNPRRDDWDATWEQSLANPQFVEQVEWELNGLEAADVVAMYFSPGTKSPITLLELGLMAQHRSYQESEFSNTIDLIVCCPSGFWRKGNVDIVCRKFDIPQVDDLDEMVAWLRKKFCR